MSASPTKLNTTLSRRQLLRTLGVGGAAASLLVACGTTNSATATTGSASAQSAASSAATTASKAAATSASATVASSSAAGTSIAAATTSVPASAASAAPTPSLKQLTISINLPPPSPTGQPDPAYTRWFDVAVNMYKQQSGIAVQTIQIAAQTADEEYQWYKTKSAASQLPDLAGTFAPTTPEQEVTNQSPAVNLDPYLQELSPWTKKAWIEDFNLDVLKWVRSTAGGLQHNFGMSPTIYKSSWIYNKAIFGKLGLKEPTTYSEFLDLGPKIKAGGFIPVAMRGKDPLPISHQTWHIGNPFEWDTWDKFSGGKDFMDPTTLYKSVICQKGFDYTLPFEKQFWTVFKMYQDQMLPPGVFGVDANTELQLFLTGKAAMYYGSNETYKTLDQAKAQGQIPKDFDVDVFPTPPIDDALASGCGCKIGPVADDGERQGMFYIPSPDLRVNKSDQITATAVNWMQFITSDSVQEAWVKPLYALPINPRVKPADPRFQSFYKNPRQLFYRDTYQAANDRAKWYQVYQGWIQGQMDYNTYASRMFTVYKDNMTQKLQLAKIPLPC